MRAQFVIPVLASILILGTLVTGLTPNAYAAQEEIVWINPPGKLGKIAEDGCDNQSCYHPFQIPKDLPDSNYNPQVDDQPVTDAGGAYFYMLNDAEDKKKSCDALEKAAQNGNGKHKGVISKEIKNNDCDKP